jgi:hypothetical protein
MDDQLVLARDLFPIEVEGESFFDILKEMPTYQVVLCLKSGYSNLNKLGSGKMRDWIGKCGENYIKNILLEEYLVNDLSEANFDADFLISRKGNINDKILIEVKNHKNEVKKHVIQKFEKYIIQNNTIGGLFISLNDVKIISIEKICHVSFLDKIPIIYLSSSDPKIIKIILQVIWNFKKDNESDFREITKICDLIHTLCLLIQNIRKTKRLLEDHLAEIHNDVLNNVRLQIDEHLQHFIIRANVFESPEICESSKTDYDLVSDDFWKIIKEIFLDTSLLKKDYHKFGINNILKIISPQRKKFRIYNSGMKIIFEASKRFLEITPFRNDMTIELKFTGKNKWRSFQISDDILKNNNLEIILDLMKTIPLDIQ